MLLYQLLLAVAALCTAGSAGFLLSHAIERRSTWLLALVMMSGAVWGGCDLMSSFAADAETARFWMRMASTGWLVLPTLVPLLVLQAIGGVGVEVPMRWKLWLIASGALEFVVASQTFTQVWTGSFIIGEVSRNAWGWTFAPGIGMYLFHAVANLSIGVSVLAIHRLLPGISEAESIQRPWLWLAIGCPMAAILVGELLNPLLDLGLPRVAGASFAVSGLIAVWQTIHYGISVMSPTRFSDEILEVLEDGVALVNADGRIRRANGGLSRISGYGQSRLVGMPITELVETPEDASEGLDDLRRVLIRADGDAIPVLASLQVLRDQQQHPVGVVVVLRDLRELEDLRRSVITNARLAAVGELAAGIAHEINNPVAFVGTNLRLLRDHWGLVTGQDATLSAEELASLVAEGRELIDESLQGVERTAEIVRGVKRFTHAGTAQRQPAQLNELLEEIISMARPQFDSADVSIERDFGVLPPVECAAQELKQVFLNLLINAVQALEGSGHVCVRTERASNLAIVSFEDDGCGVPPEIIDRIFDPFFTTKEVGVGTGLGLGIAHQIVTQHGGVITVQSEADSGTIFRVHLPIRVAKEGDA